jgi:hypothetical protein
MGVSNKALLGLLWWTRILRTEVKIRSILKYINQLTHQLKYEPTNQPTNQIHGTGFLFDNLIPSHLFAIFKKHENLLAWYSPEVKNGANHNLHFFSTFTPTIRLYIAVLIRRSKHRNLLPMLRLCGALLPRPCAPFLCRWLFTGTATPIYTIGCRS